MSLLSNAPIARKHDPSTSHEAAEHITKNGARAGQQRYVLDLVKRFPGHTSAELAVKAELSGDGLDRWTIARRLPELRTAYLVKNGDKRRCATTSLNAFTWYPV